MVTKKHVHIKATRQCKYFKPRTLSSPPRNYACINRCCMSHILQNYRIHGTIKTCQKSQHNYSIPSKLNIHPAISKCRKLLSTASIPIPNVICAVIDRIMVRYLINVLLSSNRAKKDRDVRYSYLQTKSSTYSQ